ncbi:FAD/NAD-P-binding domain-containing protein [Epithele typhae]|uniref:FAD/NAD-P-binding domain-containing protein n=1 Tax=Epithele typhae TaxID=378194 RepID=UPI002008552F|nr:FAD/NAD-P-binding domain-containing protein [Epithele typhae]KAH9934002.1 FAD/NAD-P-binding domain-containing protein [Epithele typhae]
MATQRHGFLQSLSPLCLLEQVFDLCYPSIQRVVFKLFKPPPPPGPDYLKNPKGRIAVIGAGLTGVSSAAHAIANGFEVVIYEQDDKIGGIWANVNKTSAIQFHAMLYRFFPGVRWTSSCPKRDEILSEITRVWKEYHLEPRTRLNTPVTSVKRVKGSGEKVTSDPEHSQSKWIVNGGVDGVFDAVVCTIGTCGPPLRINVPGMPEMDQDASGDSSDDEKKQGIVDAAVFQGDVMHSSEIDGVDFEGKRVIVIGSGASGVEVVETALEKGAEGCVMLARDEKWIVPRNIVFNTLLSAQLFGREKFVTSVWETCVAFLNYRGAPELVPARLRLFETTPIANNEFVGLVRDGRCEYVRCDIERLTRCGVRVKLRGREDKPGEGNKEREIQGDVIVLATGFKKPAVDFFKDDLFPESYERPNLYMHSFSTEDWSVMMTNSTYEHGLATAGHFHIGIYMRILLTFLMDPATRPTEKDMKLWVDAKRRKRTDTLRFFTYMEMVVWILLFYIFRLDRLKWFFFIMHGWRMYPKDTKKAAAE